MPRTKVSKSSKRNRETTNREEKVREFENSLDGFQSALDDKIQEFLTAFDDEVKMLFQRTPQTLLNMKMVDVFHLDFNHFADWEQYKPKALNSSLQISSNSTLIKSTKAVNPNDEGYLTEDSCSTGGSIGSAIANPAYLSNVQSLAQQQSARLRTPGPLSSARARRPRRSRSACSNLAPIPGSAIKVKQSKLSANGGIIGAEHHSRSKMRTPMATRAKALSADRTPKVETSYLTESSPTILRFPKPGELVLSKCGSPLVSQMLPENIAHLNIPLRNGVISMRPKKMSDVHQHILEELDPVTVDQLKTLKTNIDKIVNMVDKAGF